MWCTSRQTREVALDQRPLDETLRSSDRLHSSHKCLHTFVHGFSQTDMWQEDSH